MLHPGTAWNTRHSLHSNMIRDGPRLFTLDDVLPGVRHSAEHPLPLTVADPHLTCDVEGESGVYAQCPAGDSLLAASSAEVTFGEDGNSSAIHTYSYQC